MQNILVNVYNTQVLMVFRNLTQEYNILCVSQPISLFKQSFKHFQFTHQQMQFY